MRARPVALTLFCLLAATAVQAQAPYGIVGVVDQPRPDYEAEGIAIGAFRLRPALDVGASYDDNVYATTTGQKSDVSVTATPSFSLASDWSRHMVELTGSYTRTQYVSLTRESRDDGELGLDGRLDVGTAASIAGAGSLSILHEPRYAPDTPGGAASPTRYALSHLALDMNYNPARLGFAENIDFDRYDYAKTPLVGGGLFDNGDRNHAQYSVAEKISFDMEDGAQLFLRGSYGAQLFLRGSYGAQHFDQALDRNGLDRDAETYHADAGLNLQLTHLIEGEIFAGYVHEGFHAPLHDVGGFDYGATLDWYPADFLTLHLTAQDLYDDTTLDNAAVSDDRSVGLSADIEMLRDLILQAHFDYTDSRFVGIARTDNFYDAGLGAKWLLNRDMSLSAGYRFTRRSSNAAGADFNDNSVSAGLNLQL